MKDEKGEIMRKRYKIVLNLELDDPDSPFPAGGDYTHLSRLRGVVHQIMSSMIPPWRSVPYTVTLDKVVDKGEITEKVK
jgi:hypothetical protein